MGIGENPSLMDVMNACSKLGLDCLAEVGFVNRLMK